MAVEGMLVASDACNGFRSNIDGRDVAVGNVQVIDVNGGIVVGG